MSPLELKNLELRAELADLRKRLHQLALDWEKEADEWIKQPWVRKSIIGCASDLRQTLELDSSTGGA